MSGAKPPDGLEQRYLRETDTTMAQSVVAMNGIGEVLSEISVPYCFASSGSHQKMRTTLGQGRAPGPIRRESGQCLRRSPS